MGSLRTALVAWLMARSQGARFLVRIEDLDPQRSREELIATQLADLRALGIDWDEEPVRQSERTVLYREAVRALDAAGRVYPCFCTRAEVREAASAPHGDLPEGFYPGTCAALPRELGRERVARGERHALRLRAHGERLEFEDRLLGRQGSVVDDFILVRSDGVHAYQLAVVVDDAVQGIGEVVRGADLASSTPRQILLQRLLGLPTPRYAHVPLVLAADGTRLAKRDRSVTLADRGEPVGATLALLAQSIGIARGRDHVGRASELLSEFEPALVPSGPLVLS